MSQFNDLRLLNVFVSVFRHRGISAASRVLNISQPSVTRSIHKLENELGELLFERSSTGIIPTEFANRLYRRALSIVDEVDSIYADIRTLSGENRRLIRIGTGLGCWVHLNDAVLSYQAHLPNIAVNVTVASARALVSDMEDGSIDIIVANSRTIESVPWLAVDPWLSLDCYSIARADHPIFTLSDDLQLAEIHRYPFTTYHMLENAHHTAGAGSPSLRANDFLFLLRNAALSDAYLTISEEMIEYVHQMGLRIVGGQPVYTTEYSIAYRKAGETEDIRSFLKHLVKNAFSGTTPDTVLESKKE